jgi:hypothetical protein
MKRTTTVHHARRGGVLVATLVAVLAVGGLSVCLLELDTTRLKRQVASIDNKRAFNLAEAGLAEGRFAVETGHSGTVGSESAPARFGDGLFWVTATELAPNVIGLESTGMAGTGRATLSLVLRRTSRDVAALGVLGSNQVILGEHARIDAYDSGGATGAPKLPERFDPASGIAVELRSNGDISLGKDARVFGDATPGPSGSVVLGDDALVSGSTAPAPIETELAAIEVPELAPAGDLAHTNGSRRVLAGDGKSWGTIRVGKNSTLVLRGPLQMSANALRVESKGRIEIDSTSGPVELYVTDWLDLQSGSEWSAPQEDTRGLRMYVSATGTRDRDSDGVADAPVRWLASGAFFGTLYAPDARLALPAGTALYGAVAARILQLGDKAAVHFDVALRESNPTSELEVERMAWKVVEIPREIARDLGEDPFSALDVAQNELKLLVLAYESVDYEVEVEYLDMSGAKRKYKGRESDFDWKLAREVQKLRRREQKEDD